MVNLFGIYIKQNSNEVVMVLGKASSEPSNKPIIIYREINGSLKIATEEYFIQNFKQSTKLTFE